MTDEKLDQILKQALAPEINDTEIIVHRGRKSTMRKIGIIGKAIAAAAVICIIGIGGLGYFNPVLAARIPLIGGIFEQIEDDIKYSGDYSNRASFLPNEDSTDNTDASDYSAYDKGITLTASEVYCDGYSVFLTVIVETEDADFTKIPKYNNRSAAQFYIGGTWSIDGNSLEQLAYAIFEGKVIDSHTFAGLLKMDFEEKFEGSGELSLNVTSLGYDDATMLDSKDMVSHWIDGNWNIVFPLEANGNDTKTMTVGETKGNITLEDVIVTPYQVIVHTTTPKQQLELTDEMREKLLSQYPDMTDEEMLSIYSGFLPEKLHLKYPDIDLTDLELFDFSGEPYKRHYAVIFNQDGIILYWDGKIDGTTWFAVQGKQIETLHILIFDNFDDWAKTQEEGMNSSAADKAVIAVEIPIN